MFSTLLYCFIHLFHHFCDPKALVNPFQSPKQFVHMCRGVFSNEIWQFSKSGIHIFSIWAKLSLHSALGTKMSLTIHKAEIVLNILIWNTWVLCYFQVPLKGEFKKVVKMEKIASEGFNKSDTDGTALYLFFSTKHVFRWSGGTWLKKYFKGGTLLKKVWEPLPYRMCQNKRII